MNEKLVNTMADLDEDSEIIGGLGEYSQSSSGIFVMEIIYDDIGKNIVTTVMKSNRSDVKDLSVDVSTSKYYDFSCKRQVKYKFN
ncbi:MULTISPECIES: hypothetical protein [Clostridium]|uniref:Uncharacterized protein n=2 Tax=Clostridium TaxID=1485 RepID=A0ABX2TNQ3_CLOLD|nr:MULTISPECIES: hypothetical protein [Clostridium]AGY74372.1 hypothetical protein CAETHG_0137 [Clostridium autoethanogenum DSM 10061]ALU34561.1 Hypothetical protein CLAU_0132 [Clostridium autoethanogenum DSM 10061]OAA83765.1 hypothetical protein WX45_02000 [Clostridium ljungdahlii DSM 13528]OVY51281.1 hypothetical protein WX72_01413 [Clostridium autoethanogenum]